VRGVDERNKRKDARCKVNDLETKGMKTLKGVDINDVQKEARHSGQILERYKTNGAVTMTDPNRRQKGKTVQGRTAGCQH